MFSTEPPQRRASSCSDSFEQNSPTLYGPSTFSLQRKAEKPSKQTAPVQGREASVHLLRSQTFVNSNVNATDRLLDYLRVGGEIITGKPMDHVVVKNNSPDPADVHALATTQEIGSDIVIKLGPGQGHYLEHEFGHALQRELGVEVKATRYLGDIPLNHNPILEAQATRLGKEASAIGRKALAHMNHEPVSTFQQTGSAVQAKFSMGQRAPNTVIQCGLKTLENVPSRDLYAEDQAERERFKKEGGKLKEKIKSTEHQANTEIETVKPGLKLDINKTYIWVVKTINGKDEIIIGNEIHPSTGEPTQGHPTLARDPDVPEGEEGSKTVAAKTAGELKWDNQLEAWILNNKSGRYGVPHRPETGHGVDKKFTFDTSVMKGVAKLFRERIGDSKFNIRYQPWRIMNPDGTVNKNRTGQSFELKSKQIPETNVLTPSKRKRKRDTENSGEQPRRSRRIEEKNQKK